MSKTGTFHVISRLYRDKFVFEMMLQKVFHHFSSFCENRIKACIAAPNEKMIFLFHDLTFFTIWEWPWPNLKKMLFHIFPIWNHSQKNILYFPKSYRLTLFPSGGPSRPPLVVFRVLHICWMTYVRSPNLVTFPKYYRLTLFPSGRAGGFSFAAHLLIDLRSPNLVTFPNF